MKRKVVAITGGIGSGKSLVRDIVQKKGYFSIDCDSLAREVSSRPKVVQSVEQLLGSEFVENGKLNRRAIRNKIFSDCNLLESYNALFFEEVKKLLDERIGGLQGNDVSPVFVEISVFDAFEYPWDEVWLVEAKKLTRVNRVMERDLTDRQVVSDIMSRQRVCRKYTVKLTNDGTVDDLKTQVETALVNLLES